MPRLNLRKTSEKCEALNIIILHALVTSLGEAKRERKRPRIHCTVAMHLPMRQQLRPLHIRRQTRGSKRTCNRRRIKNCRSSRRFRSHLFRSHRRATVSAKRPFPSHRPRQRSRLERQHHNRRTPNGQRSRRKHHQISS